MKESDSAAARAYYVECLSISHELGDRRQVATTLCSLGQLNRSEGNLVEYRSMYRQGADLALEMKERVLMLTMYSPTLLNRPADSGDLQAVPRIAGVVEAAFEQYGTPLHATQKTVFQRLTETALSSLARRPAVHAFSEGQRHIC